MATYKKTATKRCTYQLNLDGELFTAHLRALNTPELLEVSGAMAAARRKMSGEDNASAYRDLLATIAGYIVEIEGLEDEDGAPIQWAELDFGGRLELMCEVSFKSIMDLTANYVSAGRLAPNEKKASESTSPPSTPASPADAPSAPPGDMSPGSPAGGASTQPG